MPINTNFQSPNFTSGEEGRVEYIIVHFTEMPFTEALQRLTDKQTEVSAHYLIKADGQIFQLVEESNIAWHAGLSFWLGQERLNLNSIGIELDNLGVHAFSQAQIQSCINLSKQLVEKYNIPPQNFIGHSDVAPDRKVDPGIFFDWQLFAKNGLGIWHGYEAGEPRIIYSFGDVGSGVKNLQMRLSKLGYKIEVTSKLDEQTNYVIRAFQSKFYPELIRQKGIEFYKNLNSLYSWDSESDKMLDLLVLRKKRSQSQ
ncbi:MAG: N-acetylmuramoyl-L-alanine amidase [Rickettsiaceae bacterium]